MPDGGHQQGAWDWFRREVNEEGIRCGSEEVAALVEVMLESGAEDVMQEGGVGPHGESECPHIFTIEAPDLVRYLDYFCHEPVGGVGVMQQGPVYPVEDGGCMVNSNMIKA
jgi:hypothetical protein